MIFVSAGHHQGAKGIVNDAFNEHAEALLWQSLIANALGGLALCVPAGVVREKISFVNSWSANPSRDLVVEIHFGEPDGGAGARVLYKPGDAEGARCAEKIHADLTALFPPGRGIAPGYYRGREELGQDFLFAGAECLALIIEPDTAAGGVQIAEKRAVGAKLLAETLRGLENARNQ